LAWSDQIGDFGLQLRLDLARVFRQRAVSAGIGLDLRAEEPDRSIFSTPISRANCNT
jgi:hypothetical protein